MPLAAVILAAGQGTRMKSALPKVLHPVAGRPMIEYVLDAVRGAGADRVIVVVGYEAGAVEALLTDRVEAVRQPEQLGTGHAVLQAGPLLTGYDGDILVLCGDTPLVTAEDLLTLVRAHRGAKVAATVLTAELSKPEGYGRIIRDAGGGVTGIVEQKDAGPAELAVREVNSGIYCFAAGALFDALAELTPDNAQGEYYLTDCVRRLKEAGQGVFAVRIPVATRISGINTRVQLARVEALMRREIVERLMLSGVTVPDPSSIFIDAGVRVGRDSVVYPFTFLEGQTVVGERCRIGPGARLVDATLADGVEVQYAVVKGSSLASGVTVGPFAYIRPDCAIGEGVKVGDFVELKKSVIGPGSKVPHLSYIGDATLGENVNIGAGTITCNYDGRRKWPTRIGSRSFIGSNTNLVAPVNIGEEAVTGAGSTITRDVPDGALGVARARQENLPGWSGRQSGLIKKSFPPDE
ncbi:MAG: bifunctional UDP-N-acetylglucosamine diphosphorylase/glucosamine-1-phosphate N-acetyltransferase GlmU [Peptococcaceae bacterium]|jgi:bifunctional UDP-N-acetylglucosamine pyrophosphorylase/glucosamine-1-phosphate N-acetyltransferase|nr:bifunctional UDP-N-acetylglucosamine diphosphorylase/glucosamine-1-phosphate N-acetyltransferase GlmU [Peptococcaceae bacterium]